MSWGEGWRSFWNSWRIGSLVSDTGCFLLFQTKHGRKAESLQTVSVRRFLNTGRRIPVSYNCFGSSLKGKHQSAPRPRESLLVLFLHDCWLFQGKRVLLDHCCEQETSRTKPQTRVVIYLTYGTKDKNAITILLGRFLPTIFFTYYSHLKKD